jgi:hypothetical protein
MPSSIRAFLAATPASLRLVAGIFVTALLAAAVSLMVQKDQSQGADQ